jgi:hypothetical protein
MPLETGQRVRIPGKGLPDVVTIGSVQKTSDGLKLYVEDASGAAYPVALTANEAELVVPRRSSLNVAHDASLAS